MSAVYFTVVTLAILVYIGFRMAQVLVFNQQTNKTLFEIVWFIAFPALIIGVFMNSKFEWQYIKLTACCWIVSAIMLGLIMTFYIIVNIVRSGSFERTDLGTIILLVVVTNSSWVGYPLVLGILGQEAMTRAVISSELWTTVAVQLMVVLMPVFFGKFSNYKTITPTSIALDMIKKPVILALPIGIAMFFVSHQLPERFHSIFDFVKHCTNLLIPCICFYVGVFLFLNKGKSAGTAKREWTRAVITSIILLIGVPVLTYYIGQLMGLDQLSIRVITLLAATPPILISVVITEKSDLNMSLTIKTLLLSFPLSIITVTLLCHFLLHI